MSYILGAQCDEDVFGAFERYAAYVEAERHRFPLSVLKLLNSDWYFNFSDHRCPHDAWLEDACICEDRPVEGDGSPEISIHLRLRGAYHDGIIEFQYAGVTAYRFHMLKLTKGHSDWRYDEFRLSEAGDLIHEIEWCGMEDTGRWLIQCRDVVHSFHPFDSETS